MKYQDLLDLLIKKNLTISSMESLTGGLFASCFTSISNASKAYKGSIVTYTNEIKEKAGVKKETIDKYSAISKECVLEMAQNCKSYFDTDIAVSFSGNAGPTASEGKEVGLVYICVIVKNNTNVFELHLDGTRNEIRNRCVEFAFDKIIEIVHNLF